MPQLPMPSTLLQLSMLPTLSMPQLLPTQWPMLFTLPQLLLMLSTLLQLLPQLSSRLLQLTTLRNTPMRFPHTPTPTLLPITTQSPTSTLRSSPMVPATLPDLTQLLFPMDVSNMSSTLPMVMMDMSPMSLTREPLSTQRRSHTSQPQPQLTMPKPSLCFVNIY